MTSPLKTFDALDPWVEAMRSDMVASLSEGISKRGVASLIVSGGSTPAPIFEALSHEDLDWSKVTIALVDERWVPVTHKASNEKLIRETLLQNRASNAEFVGMSSGCFTPQMGLPRAKVDYANIPQPFDYVLLGMGPDGHTASLFPHAKGLAHALRTEDLLVAIRAKQSTVTGEYLDRMSLSLFAIKSARKVALAISGEGKLDVWRTAQSDDTPVRKMPVKAVLQADNITTFWRP